MFRCVHIFVIVLSVRWRTSAQFCVSSLQLNIEFRYVWPSCLSLNSEGCWVWLLRFDTEILCKQTSFIMTALWNSVGDYIFFLCFLLSMFLVFCVLSFFLFSSPFLSRRRLDVYHTSADGVACFIVNLGCRSEMYCRWLDENTRRKNCEKFAIWTPSHKFVELYFQS